ncbi:hypothetical protein GCM10007160_27650 [Litchfieldella qijiaojingensis]|uniref:Peptidase S8/S53 domain-containing protein n=1 Tax=Litchfieldella qijiaojingensis TaxID=980347 RepID=A0ABQ2Z130_9GAMM|nr:S8 family serine peptidase [Halomonas qijiaojingensis]GGX98573.1 hypothetical protein GCM10007160_27650 [Halomonas qijiaojingensis]
MQNSSYTVATIAALSLLTACASGGGGGGGTGGDGSSAGDDSSGSGSTDPEITMANDEILVGVADSGFRLTHESFSDQVRSTANLADTSSSDVTTDPDHGTAVTSLASDTMANSALLLAKVNDDSVGMAWTNVLDYSVGYLADEGARVINLSYEGRMEAPHPSASYNGVNSLDSLHKVTTSNNGLGSVYVVAAGNTGAAIQASNPIHQYDGIFENMLIVGGSDGNDIHPASAYPGEDADWQSRFLVAPMFAEIALATGDQDYGLGGGTSFAAAQVTAAAADIMGKWPHLTATEVSGLLLSTASQDSPLYSSNNCGSGGNINCGDYYFGQGKLDLEEALEPQGTLSLPTGSTVDGASMDPYSSSAALSASFGDAYRNSAALRDVAAFDDLGRDYRVDLSGSIVAKHDHAERQANRMTRVAAQQQQVTEQRMTTWNDWVLASRYQSGPGSMASSFKVDTGNYAFGIFHLQGDAATPSALSDDLSMMPMMSFQEAGGTLEALSQLIGVDSSMSLSDNLQLGLRHWQGDPGDTTSTLSEAYTARHSDVSMTYSATDRLDVTAAMGITREDGGFLGAQGQGALSLGDDGRMTTSRLKLDFDVTDTITTFALYAQGTGGTDTSSGLIQSIENARTEELAMGLLWQDGPHAAGFTYRHPQRLDSGKATLSVPVGRTLDGTVIREERELDLTPSGRQQDFEFGYAVSPSDRSQLQFNFLYTLEPSHDSSASDDWAAMFSYQAEF